MKIRQRTTTSLVLETLQTTDDFMTVDMLKRITGRNNLGDVRQALLGLHKYGAAGFIAERDQVWWYATGEDKRIRQILEIVPDIKRNQPHGVKRPRKVKP